jgi:hypothetical protein
MQSDIVNRLREATVPRLEMGWPAPHVVQRKEPLWMEAAAEIERLRAELAAMQKQRDEARIRVCELCARIGGVYRRVNREVVECRTPEEIAEVCDWDCFAEKERGGA